MESDEKTVGTIGSKVVGPVVPTMDERVERLEAILKQFETAPPPMADADVFRVEIEALRGEVNGLHALMRNYDGFADMCVQMAGKMKRFEENGSTTEVSVRDTSHETKQHRRIFICTVCDAESSDVQLVAQSSNSEKPCPVCGSIARVMRCEDVDADATGTV